ncbi:MAG: DUF6335 family protein [Acidobacteriota bacterium]
MKKPNQEFIDVGRVESEIYEPSEEVLEEFAEVQRFATNKELFTDESVKGHAAEHHQDESGEEAIGGFITTTDDDLVDEMGEAAGLSYADDEPLHTPEKIEERDRHRWELDPASSEDYQQRVNHEGE